MVSVAPSATRHLVYGQNKGDCCLLIYSDGTQEAVDHSLKEVLNEICLLHGSSLEGRTASFRFIIGNVYKACILLDEKSEAILMPSGPLDQKGTSVILYNDIVRFDQEQDGFTAVYLKSGITLKINASMKSLRLQMKRCEKYLAALDQRLES